MPPSSSGGEGGIMGFLTSTNNVLDKTNRILTFVYIGVVVVGLIVVFIFFSLAMP